MVNSRLKIAFPLVCVLLMATFVAPVWAAEYDPGVAVGQWVKYGDYVVTTPAESVVSPNWSMIEVVEVSGKEVTLRITGEYMNGTAIPPSQVLCNIETFKINETLSVYQNYLFAANLNQGDKTLNVTDAPTINKTETRTILGTNRTVNILNFTNSYPGQAMKSIIIFDQLSGMALGMEVEITLIAQAVTYTSSYSVIDTNIFDCEPVPEFQSWLIILPMFMVASLLVIITQKRKYTAQQ